MRFKTTWVSRNPELAKQLLKEAEEKLAILEEEAKSEASKRHQREQNPVQ